MNSIKGFSNQNIVFPFTATKAIVYYRLQIIWWEHLGMSYLSLLEVLQAKPKPSISFVEFNVWMTAALWSWMCPGRILKQKTTNLRIARLCKSKTHGKETCKAAQNEELCHTDGNYTDSCTIYDLEQNTVHTIVVSVYQRLQKTVFIYRQTKRLNIAVCLYFCQFFSGSEIVILFTFITQTVSTVSSIFNKCCRF